MKHEDAESTVTGDGFDPIHESAAPPLPAVGLANGDAFDFSRGFVEGPKTSSPDSRAVPTGNQMGGGSFVFVDLTVGGNALLFDEHCPADSERFVEWRLVSNDFDDSTSHWW